MTCEIPVATMVWYSCMQSFYRLEYYLYRCRHSFRSEHLYYLTIYLLNCERLVDCTYSIFHIFLRLLQFSLAVLVGLIKDVEQVAFLEQLYCCTEHTELFQTRHVNAIVIRIANLWSRANNDNLLWMQTVEDTKDTLLKSCTTHDAVVDYHEVVFVRHDTLIGYIVYMRSQVIT